MSELFFDTIDESEIPAGMARVRYEAGAVEPLYANDEFFSLLGYQRRSIASIVDCSIFSLSRISELFRIEYPCISILE